MTNAIESNVKELALINNPLAETSDHDEATFKPGHYIVQGYKKGQIIDRKFLVKGDIYAVAPLKDLRNLRNPEFKGEFLVRIRSIKASDSPKNLTYVMRLIRKDIDGANILRASEPRRMKAIEGNAATPAVI